MRKPWSVPAALPGGSLVPAMRWQDFAPMATSCWIDAGGYDHWREILATDKDKFHELAMTLTKKTIPSMSVNVAVGVEDLLDQLDAKERDTIDGEAVEIDA